MDLELRNWEISLGERTGGGLSGSGSPGALLVGQDGVSWGQPGNTSPESLQGPGSSVSSALLTIVALVWTLEVCQNFFLISVTMVQYLWQIFNLRSLPAWYRCAEMF